MIAKKQSLTGNISNPSKLRGNVSSGSELNGKVVVGRPLATVETSEIEGGYKITVTDTGGVQELYVMNGKDGYTPQKNVDYFDGNDGVSCTHSWEGTTLTVTSASGTSSVNLKGETGSAGYTPQKGIDYFDGADGYTPQKGVDYFDGKDGKDGKNGQDGYTPVKGKDYFDGKDGQNGKDGSAGKDGQDGYTPIKGKDYFDGKDGVDGRTPVKGTDYFTEVDKAEMVDAVKAQLITEQWTFTLTDGTTVTKDVVTE